MKKVLAIILSVMFVAVMAIPAFAANDNGTITIKGTDSVSIEGKTFNAYKILDVEAKTADSTKMAYKVPAALADFYATEFLLDKTEKDFDAQVTAKIATVADINAFANKALAAAKDANITPASATGETGATEVAIANLPYGYYVIEDTGATSPVSAVMLDTATKAEIVVKADKPTINKVIEGAKDTDPATTEDVKVNNASIGDKVPFKATTKVPSMTGYTKYYFVVTDTLDNGLSYNTDMKVTLIHKEDGVAADAAEEDITARTTITVDGQTVKVVFNNFIQFAADAGDEIVLTYSANVDTDAVIGSKGNDNNVNLIYSNNPNVTDNGVDEPEDSNPETSTVIGKTPDSTTTTYVTALTITKVDADDDSVLAGAEFEIIGTRLNTVKITKDVFTADEAGTYYLLKDGTYTTTAPVAATDDNAGTESYYTSTDVKYVLTKETETVEKAENVTYTGVTDTEGKLTFTGLSAGTYTIEEIKAPAGYNILKDAITVIISCEAPAAADNDCVWTATVDGDDATIVDGIVTMTVENTTGTELPSTGGIGTYIFYIIGAILVIGAGIILFSKKRTNTVAE